MFKDVLGFRFFLSVAVVFVSTGHFSAIASESADERAQLSLLLRQLNALERLVDYGDTLPDESSARVHFNYTRLREDLHRIRKGIDDYLTPRRAQPRDPAALHGHYHDVVMVAP
nr:RAQPRD family integrative conjugative element protein [Pseudomonas caspiana]